jgi:hypothetical protein
MSTSQMMNWDKARIAVNIGYPNPVSRVMMQQTVSMPNSMSINTSFPVEPYHSISEYNMGYIEKPPVFTFSIGVPSTSPSASLFRALETARYPFNLECRDATDTTTDTQFKLFRETLVECRFESKDITIAVGDIPMVAFKGKALRYHYGYLSGGVLVDNPVDQTAYENYFGGGNENPSLLAIFSKWIT